MRRGEHSVSGAQHSEQRRTSCSPARQQCRAALQRGRRPQPHVDHLAEQVDGQLDLFGTTADTCPDQDK